MSIGGDRTSLFSGMVAAAGAREVTRLGPASSGPGRPPPDSELARRLRKMLRILAIPGLPPLPLPLALLPPLSDEGRLA